MKRIIPILTYLLLSGNVAVHAQRTSLKVGNNPLAIQNSVALEVESTTKGFLPPRLTNAQMNAIDSPAKGLIVYCTDCTTEGIMLNTGTSTAANWVSLGSNSNQNNGDCPTVTTDCNIGGFTGNYTATITQWDQRNFSVTLSNNTFNPTVIPFAASDLVLSSPDFSVSGLTVGTPSANLPLTNGTVTLAAGQSVVVTYPVYGSIISGCGSLNGLWKKVTLTCNKTVFVNNLVNCLAGVWTTPVSPSDQFGLTNNTAYSGFYSIPYSGGGCTIPAESLLSNGLRLTLTNTTLPSSPTGTQNLVYELSGTYTGPTGGSVTFTTSNGCKVIVGICLTPAINTGNGTTARFLCHNLGANVTIDPHTPNVELVGAYVQFGKRGPTSPSGDSRYDWQTAASDGPSGFAAAPTASNPNSGAVTSWSTVDPGHNAWREFWSGGKTETDPCPPGFRVPISSDLDAVVNNNTASRTGTWTNSVTNYGSAIHFGPNASTKQITFPSSGYRDGTGSSTNRGSLGSYWLRDRIDTGGSRVFYFDNSQVIFTTWGRTNGLPVRCIKHVI